MPHNKPFDGKLIRTILTTVIKTTMKHILFVFLFPVLLHAQSNDQVSVDRVTVESKVLGENRSIYIQYPKPNPKNAAMSYPVLYLLDGESHFDLVSQQCTYLSRWDVNVMPEMIVVGIVNTNRVRDLTPSHSVLDYFGKTDTSATSRLKPSGGNDMFFQFMQNELMPYINSHYRTQPFKILAGHSFGGITVVNGLLTRPELFNAYVSVSPSFWWDRGYLLKLADQKLEKGTTFNKILFYSDGNEGVSDNSPFHSNLLTFDSLLNTRALPGLIYKYVYYPEESHMSEPLFAYADALRFIFKPWALPPISEKEVTGEYILKHYTMLTQRYGYTILPNEENIYDWALWLANKPENVDNAISLLEMLANVYPSSSKTFITLGNVYVKKGDKKKAQSNYQKAAILDPNSAGLIGKLK
jgi:predicted alpha/beta superfamily hydrolase